MPKHLLHFGRCRCGRSACSDAFLQVLFQSLVPNIHIFSENEMKRSLAVNSFNMWLDLFLHAVTHPHPSLPMVIGLKHN